MERINDMEARLKIVEKRSLRIEIATWVSIGLALVRLAIPVKTEQPQSQASENHNTSVKVGSMKDSDPQRDWLTVAEVAENEGLSERTITTYITTGRISAQKSNRSYRVPKDYKVSPPLTADNSSN